MKNLKEIVERSRENKIDNHDESNAVFTAVQVSLEKLKDFSKKIVFKYLRNFFKLKVLKI